MRHQVGERDLRLQIEDLRGSYPRLKDHELFLLWFLHAMVTEDVTKAAGALTGNPRDKGADAIIIDDRAKVAFVAQSKYRGKINGSTERRSDVIAFTGLAHDLFGTEDEFRALLKGTDPRVHEGLREVRDRIRRRGYSLKLYYVTTGRCSTHLIEQAERACRSAGGPTSIEVFDGNQVLHALGEYLDGVAPPVPAMDLPLEIGHGVACECLRRHDTRSGITAWIFSMNAASVAEMYETAGIRLFARNVRGYLGGNKDVNKGIESTIKNEPANFWYYNNGITIVCDSAQRISIGGKDVMRVQNPQVINGQQTTRTLHSSADPNSAASVIVRAIEIPRHDDESVERFDTLVTRVVAATNFQNSISASDLMSNDRRQVEIERELRKFGYAYLRKKQAKSEARRFIGQHYTMVTKEELAQAVAACELDPDVVRSEGKERLFEEQFYSKVFPNSDPLFYLTRYRLMREVRHASSGYPERAYAKWLVLHYMWSRLTQIIQPRSMKMVFLEASQRNLKPMELLWHANNTAFRAALTFYRKNRGSGERATDVSTFFKKKGRLPEYERYLQSEGKHFRVTVDRSWSRFETLLRSANEGHPKSKPAFAT
jgi:AIPR protein